MSNNNVQQLEKSIIFFWYNAKLDLYYVKHNQILKHSSLYDQDRTGFVFDNFIISPNETLTLYVKSNEKKGYDVFKSIKIVNQEKTFSVISTDKSYFDNGFFFGILISIFFFNLIVFFSIKEKSLGYYCLVLLPPTLYCSPDIVVLLEWLNFSNKNIIVLFNIFFPALHIITFLLFTKYFFETENNYLWVDKFINISLLFSLILNIYNFIFDHYSYIIAALILPFFFMVGIVNLKKDFTVSVLYIISSAFIYYPFIFYFSSFDIKFFDTYLNKGTYINNMQVTNTIAAILLCFSIYIRLSKLFYEKLSFQKELLAKSRLAAMGEMIASIAHQWRQPLNNVSTTLANIEMTSELQMLSHEKLKTKVHEANTQIKYMSNTINDFLNFFSTKKEERVFLLKSAVESAMVLLRTPFKQEQISLHVKSDESTIIGCKNELIQVLTILMSNAKDALKTKEDKQIWITIKNKEIFIEDNAEGIDLEIIEKIFDPYFSTKKEKNGTGLGLYMAKIIIEKNIGGSLHVKNSKKGAKFIIDLSHVN
ncbi:sensor histidine kinase [Sulfurospirillum diekertiae]|nr:MULTISPECIES: sensor histidine kinase [Sulfurospirillum]QIR74695.2 sensor histidine kinase [Sulfurospirillum diekertiae]